MSTVTNPLIREFLESGAPDLEEADRLLESGRPKEAMAIYVVAFYDDIQRERAAAWAARCCLEMRVPHEALVWALYIEQFDPDLGGMLRAAAFCQLRDFDAAAAGAEGCDLSALERIGLGSEHGAIVLAAVCIARNCPADAMPRILAEIDAHPDLPDLWAYLAMLVAEYAVVDDAVIACVQRHELLTALAWMRQGEPKGADHVLEALWSRKPGDAVLIAAAADAGPYLAIDRCVEWSTRMRTIGLDAYCPLRKKAELAEIPAIDRVQAAVLVHAAFGDTDAGALIQYACGALSSSDAETGLTIVADMAMDHFEAAINGAADDVETALVVARFLAAGGALDGALAVTDHALRLAAADPIWTQAATARAIREYLGPELVVELVAGFTAAGAADLAEVLTNACA